MSGLEPGPSPGPESPEAWRPLLTDSPVHPGRLLPPTLHYLAVIRETMLRPIGRGVHSVLVVVEQLGAGLHVARSKDAHTVVAVHLQPHVRVQPQALKT